jgi:hypothetical protein
MRVNKNMLSKIGEFIQFKFDLLLMTILFVALYRSWATYGFPNELRDFVWLAFGSLGTLIGQKFATPGRGNPIPPPDGFSATAETTLSVEPAPAGKPETKSEVRKIESSIT